MRKLNYGIDAPKVIRNLIGIGFILLLCHLFLKDEWFPPISAILHHSSLLPAICLLFTGIVMILYAKIGKFKHRDRIIDLYNWTGNEQVLDVGTGLGLLMIGVAKKLTTGKSYGIDIFNTYDLSDNNIEQTRTNVELENVTQKVEILKGNILGTQFENEKFDVIVSNLCLHNLYKQEERNQACKEMYRILKPSGQIIISDYKNTSEYIKSFEELDMKVEKIGTYFLDTFPPLTIIKATKQ